MSLGIFWFSLGWSNYCIDFAYSSQFLPKPALLRLILGQQVLSSRLILKRWVGQIMLVAKQCIFHVRYS